jgi:hypothetical protein
MKIYVDESPMGSGKTHRAIHDITSTTCKALFFTERTDRFAELHHAISKAATQNGTCPLVVPISSVAHGRGSSVTRRIESLPQDYADRDHVIVLATHAAMLQSDFSDFQGWQIIVDEVPQFLTFEEKRTHLDVEFFAKYYRLEVFEEGWSGVTLTDEGAKLTPANLRNCESHEHLAVFHRRVTEASRANATRYVLCNLPDWQAMTDGNVQWCWASAFSLWELRAFDKVVMLGNRFRRDIGSILSERMSDEPIEWVALQPAQRNAEFRHRRVHISYFSETRQASRSLFETEKGQTALREIGAHLSDALRHEDFIWSANATTASPLANSPQESLRAGGLATQRWIPPRQAGTNNYSKISHAAMIYSAKAPPNLRGLLRLLGIDEELWTKSVEHETICQFMTRTSVRDPDCEAPVHLWVFDRAQALYLKRYFDGLAHVTATVAQVMGGPEIPRGESPGPKKAVRTPEEQAAYEEGKRRRDAERKRRKRAEERRFTATRKAA